MDPIVRRVSKLLILMKNIHTKDQIREILFSCLQCFVIENQELIKSDVNERTLTA